MNVDTHAVSRARRVEQSGQALTEFLVLSGVLVAFLVLLPVIGKYQDVSHATQMASRYVAFDAAMNGGGGSSFSNSADVDAAVRRRFFAESTAPVKTRDVAGDFAAHSNANWTMPNGRSLLPQKSDIHAGGVMSSDPSDSLFLLRSAMALDGTGLVNATVTAPLARMPQGVQALESLAALDISMQRRMVMMVNPWTASGYAATNAVVARTTQLQTASVRTMAVPAQVAVNIGFDPGVRAPQVGDLQRWQDLVPTDRRR